MKLMNLPDMQALVAVAEAGSLAHAAIKLRLTQPAITRRIQRLEDALGVALLDRDVKPARLTAEGRSAYAECIRILRAAEGLKGIANGSAVEGRPMRIGVSYGAADLLLRTLLPTPKAAGDISVEVGKSRRLEAAVAERRFDAVLVVRDERGDTRIGEMLALLPVHVAAPKSFKLPRRIALKDLRDRRWVLCPDGCGYRRALEHGLYGAAQPLDIAIAIWGFERQAELVADGVGLGLIPARILETHPRRREIDIVEVRDFSAAVSLWLIRSDAIPALDTRLETLLARIRGFLSEPSARVA
jgi:DNA-binding transcriptional LysR family regulator